MIVYYYRTTRADVLGAHTADEMAVARIEATAERFAKQFGARPYFTVGFDSHFAGIGFDKDYPCHYPDLWTKPKPDNPCQVPRSPERAGSKLHPIAERLYKQFHDTWPKEEAQPRPSELLKVLGLAHVDTSKLLLVYVEARGVAYLASSYQLMLDEVVASEFVHARELVQPNLITQEAANG